MLYQITILATPSHLAVQCDLYSMADYLNMVPTFTLRWDPFYSKSISNSEWYFELISN